MAQGYVYEDAPVGWRPIAAGDLPAGVGTVSNVSSANSAIAVANPTTTPTLTLATLDVIATDGPPAADWSNNSKKITAVKDPTIAQDAATKNYVDTHSGSGTISSITSTGASIAVTAPSGPTTNVDLPASGVSAGTYGDATHTAQVNINAKGVVTSASQVSISGIAGTGLVKLFDSTLGAAAATIDTGAGGIPGGHADLFVFLLGRSAQAGAGSDNVLMRFNNDSGANYDWAWDRGTNAGTATASAFTATSATVAQFPQVSVTAGLPSYSSIRIPSYDATTFWKVGDLLTGILVASTNWSAEEGTLMWHSTAAITQIAILTASGSNLVTGSRMVIYGAQ